jgi:hypothetical protein
MSVPINLSPISNETEAGPEIPNSSAPATLILSKNSLRNATYDCDALGIHFRLSTPTDGIKLTRVTNVYRWNSETNEDTLVAEWENNTGKADRFSVKEVTERFELAADENANVERSPQGETLMRVSREVFLPKKGGIPLTIYG